MANPHKGEVSIDLQRSINKRLLVTHGRPLTLKFDVNSMSEAEREFKGDKTVPYLLALLNDDPTRVSFDDTRILLEWGMKHQYGNITKETAGKILMVEDWKYMTGKIGEALGLAMAGIFGAEDGKKMEVEPMEPTEAEDEDDEEPIEEGAPLELPEDQPKNG